jgi:hypothetical protein
MLDYRAWIIAAILLTAAIGSYFVWLNRTRAQFHARSLSAAPKPPNNNPTHLLHVDGCDKDFLVKVGELVEPRVVPGAPLERFRAIYGKETRFDKLGPAWTWDKDPFTLLDVNPKPDSPGNSVSIDVKQGHVVETLDGIELGIDSFGTLLHKLRDRQIPVHERIDGPEGDWVLTVSFYSDCSHKFRSEYSRILPGGPEIDSKIVPPSNDPRAGALPWRSDVFMNKVITHYTLAPSNGTDDSPTAGQPADHN